MDLQAETKSPCNRLDLLELETALAQALRSTLFSSGLTISPRRVSQIGHEFGAAFCEFCGNQDLTQARVLGERLAQEGLGTRSLLTMTDSLRRLCTEKSDPLKELLEITTDFVNAVLEAFVLSRERRLLEIQDRTHRAHITALMRKQEESD